MREALSKELNEGLRDWLDARLAALCRDEDGDVEGLPAIVDFLCVIAVENVADSDSDTYYHTISSGTSHYRKVGLAKTMLRILLRDDDTD